MKSSWQADRVGDLRQHVQTDQLMQPRDDTLMLNLMSTSMTGFGHSFLCGMNLMISSQNCILQQSSVNCWNQCVRMKVSLQKVSACM